MSRSNRDGKRGGGYKNFDLDCDQVCLSVKFKNKCSGFGRCKNPFSRHRIKNKKALLARVKDEDYNI